MDRPSPSMVSLPILSLSLVSLLSLSAAPLGPAPEGRALCAVYGPSQGLRNAAVLCLLQDADGFLWAGTEGGAYRYDGHRFEAFGTRQGLPSGEIRSLHQTPDGTLWFGTYLGLARQPRGASSITVVPGTRRAVDALCTGPEGGVWFTSGEGPWRVSANGTAEAVPGWPGGEATALCASGDRIWVASSRRESDEDRSRVYCYHRGTWTEVQGPFDQEPLDALASDPQGGIWARSASRLWSSAMGRQPFTPCALPAVVKDTRGSLFIGRNGDLWIPSPGRLLHRTQGRWESISTGQGTGATSVRVVLEDRESNLWMGGLELMRRLGRGRIEVFTRQEGLPNAIIWAIRRDAKGTLWVGSSRGLLTSTASGWKVHPGTEQMIVRSIQHDSRGRVYYAGNLPEVFCLDPGTGQMRRFPLEGGQGTRRILRLKIDAQERLWIGTERGGLQMADLRTPAPVVQRVAQAGLGRSERITDITEDAQGHVFAVGASGLSVLDGDTWRHLPLGGGFRDETLSYARCTPGGDLLLASFESSTVLRVRYAQGAVRIVGQETFSHLDTDAPIYQVGEDARGRLWVGTGRGLLVRTAAGTERVGTEEGMPSDDCNAQALFFDADGSTWVGTSGGLAHFASSGPAGPPAPPSTLLLSVRTPRQELPLEAHAQRIPAGANTLEFRFAGISFVSEGQVAHQVRLVGLEDNWRDTDVRVARYPSLPAGHYRFEARARVGLGEWGPVSSYAFTVLPPWWSTWWARSLGVSILGALLWSLVRFRLRQVRRHAAKLEAIIAERTQALQDANEALRTQSLTDPLTGLHNRRYLGVSLPQDIAQVNRLHRTLSLGLEERLRANVDLFFLMVDLDHFKAINDTHGHQAGDRVLQQVAQLLRRATRDTDTVVRWGGEEFLIVARNACRKEGARLAERIRAMVEKHPFDIGNGQFLRRTCSIGFAFHPLCSADPERFNWEQVVNLADQCLYTAKHSGRNAWVGLVHLDEEHLDPSLRLNGLDLHDLIQLAGGHLSTSLAPDALPAALRQPVAPAILEAVEV